MPGILTASVACALADDQGKTHSDQPGVGWQVRHQAAGTLIFDAAQPLARAMKLRVPAVDLALDGATTFDVVSWLKTLSIPAEVPLGGSGCGCPAVIMVQPVQHREGDDLAFPLSLWT